ncbi:MULTISPECIES: hypothetical protein [Thalassospira]|uniref:Solute-binding protein family 3/N-terminal domain-containing protein n=1 Tax=Thalassospira aquimaris TaxID=3037796 RepID=A0ABT6GEA7_9PROT|nr:MULTISPECIES: hypothetical protein [Thalassospira]MDG4720330.1 hypothetical protein [Thalassospira sp. FZY0004]
MALFGDANEGPFSYQYDVLRLAVEHAEGDHQLIFEDFGDASVSRILDLMERGNIDVMFAGYTREREQRFAQIYVPLTRGILGYRVFVARPETAEVLESINTIEELKKHCIGSGVDWLDSDILERNGFCVEKSSYENLWRMLSHGRFDLLNRGLHEVHGERDLVKSAGLVIDQSVVLAYPMDFFFYVRADDRNRQNILTNGLLNAYDTGAFMRNFYSNIGIARSLRAIKDPNRKVFFVDNPFLSGRVKGIPDQYWEKENPGDLSGSCAGCPLDALID